MMQDEAQQIRIVVVESGRLNKRVERAPGCALPYPSQTHIALTEPGRRKPARDDLGVLADQIDGA